MTKEIHRLEKISADSWYCRGANLSTIQYSIRIFDRFMVPGSVLELGPAEGVATEFLLKKWQDITVVEGSDRFCELLKEKFPQIRVINALFEDFSPQGMYDNIILGHVLEHVENPVDILSRARTWLSDHGKIFAAVPNSRSIHRQAAVIMGLLKQEDELNETDFHHGHRRVYNPERFRSDFLKAGLNIQIFGGYWLKPVSNAQIEQTWTEEMLQAFMILGERYPDIAAENYIVATK